MAGIWAYRKSKWALAEPRTGSQDSRDEILKAGDATFCQPRVP